MGSETRTEFEVVEHDVDVDYCDGCGREDCTLIELPIGLEGKVTVSHELQEVEKPNRSEIMDFGNPYKNNPIPMDEARSLASRDREHQLETTKIAELCKADEVIDACPNCLREAFGSDVPENYERLDIESEYAWGLNRDVDDYDWERLNELVTEHHKTTESDGLPTGPFNPFGRLINSVFDFFADSMRLIFDRDDLWRLYALCMFAIYLGMLAHELGLF